ncbi:MAG: 50S ribosomal protein L6 [Gemmatimonadales bacterium]|jgi:large subunit ribosomal protein L6|nr:50S ribosomal protein L6 [Gemmatimonadales bacterium]
MSRIGRRPVTVPQGVTVALEGHQVAVKGPKGELQRSLPAEMRVTQADGTLRVERPSDSGRHRSLHGLTRSLLQNMIDGVTGGFSRQLEIHGVGYKAEPSATGVRLVVGYSHPVDYKAPAGIQIKVENPTLVTVHGIDKELVGQVASELRRVRPPEPYKGKGIRYVGEHVRRKAGKTGG